MEHSKQSVELCGWAVVYDGSAEGELKDLESSALRDGKNGEATLKNWEHVDQPLPCSKAAMPASIQDLTRKLRLSSSMKSSLGPMRGVLSQSR
jgi:hypothetical protein